jgi:hypothetical protein
MGTTSMPRMNAAAATAAPVVTARRPARMALITVVIVDPDGNEIEVLGPASDDAPITY